MKELIQWVVSRRFAVIAVAVVFAPSLSFVTAAVMALQMAYRGPVTAIGDALIAALAVAVIALLAGGGPAMVIDGCSAIAFGLLIGAIFRVARNFGLSIQALLLLAYAAVLLYSLFGPTTSVLLDEVFSQALELLRSQGRSEVELAAMEAKRPRLIGAIAVELLVRLLVIMAIAYWALGIARNDRRLAVEFRQLRLGYVLGLPGVLIVIGALAFENAVIHNLCGIAICGFALQLLALLHQRAAEANWHPITFVPVYVLGVPILILFALLGVFGLDV